MLNGSTNQSLLGRIIATGAPALIASALMYLQPIVGRPFLSDAEYATWALAASVFAVGVVFDLGGSAYVAAAGSAGSLNRNQVTRAVGLSVVGALLPGFIAVLLWPSYSDAKQFALPGSAGMLFFCTVALAASARSVVVVASAALLAQNMHRRRGILLLSQAVLHLLLLSLLLSAGLQLWAMPVSALLATAFMSPFCLSALRTVTALQPAASRLKLSTFVWAKTGLLLMGMVLTQADRWVVGAFLDAGTVAQYDVMARLAGMPRLAIIGLSGVLVSDAASITSERRAISALYRRSLSITAVLAAGGSAAVMVVALAWPSSLGRVNWVLLSVLIIGYSLNAMTAPGTLILTGIGMPQVEFQYLLPCAATAAGLWTVGSVLNSDTLALYASSVSLAVWSAYFVVRVRRRLYAC